MLVLCRKTQQQIQIGENIVITILQIKGQTVRVGIEAPRDVHVLRSELSITPDQVTDSAPPTLPPRREISRTVPSHNRLRRWPLSVMKLTR
jgi:carbon storage regulator CsrA